MNAKCTFKSKRALAMIDIVVTICVLALLGVILLPIIHADREKANRSRCMGNIKEIGDSLFLYAKEFNDKLPDATTNNPAYYGTSWPWDLNTNLAGDLQQKGLTRPVLYCPSNPSMNDDVHWNYWNYFPGSRIRVVGYAFLINGGIEIPTNLWRVGINKKDNFKYSDMELVIDAVASTDGDYTQIRGRMMDRTSHLHGRIPAGGNILFMDGHAEWRDFKDMQPQIPLDGGVVWYF